MAMTELERFLKCMNYEAVDHAPFWSWWGWPETVERWKKEGFDPGRFHPDARCDKRVWASGWFVPNPGFERKVIEDDGRNIVYVNSEGIVMKERKDNPASSMPQFIKFPVETTEEFRRFWVERMQPDLTKRIGPDWRADLQEMRAQPRPFIVISDRWGGFFGPLRNLVGVERLCMLFYDDPALIEEMMEAEAQFIIDIMGQVLDVVTIDAFGFWEDMAYNHAPLISPEMVRKHMAPRYKKVVEFLRGRGVPYVGLDCDGMIDSLIPVWMDAGMNFLYPFEVQCGMDVNAVRKKFGRNLRMWGGVDKRALAKGPVAIDAELARLKPLIDEGGFIPHTDHSSPPDVSYANYCYYMQKLEKTCRR